MANYRQVAPGIDEWKTENAEIRVWSPGPGLVATRLRGVADRQIVPHFIEPITRVLATGHRFKAFHDWEGLTGYDTEARVRIATWGVRFVRQIERIHILVAAESSFVRMAIAVTNVALQGTITTYYDRPAFEAAYVRTTHRPWSAGPD